MSWGRFTNLDIAHRSRFFFDFEMLQLSIGRVPEDLEIVFDDPWAMNALAADFWSGIDGDSDRELDTGHT